jgi:peptidoglycan/LPS O-acetylase OafA/YrhL
LSSSSAVHRFHDGWRIAAASVVLLSHAWALGIIGNDSEFLSRLAHLAVIIFFVISGHAVTSSFDRYRDAKRFLTARLSRIYAIVIPALIFTLILDLSVGVSNVGYPKWQYPHWWAHIALNLGFIGESWKMNHRPFSVIPYWSLAYEYWYYLFIACFAVKHKTIAMLLMFVVLLIAGPKIILLMPCWLLGVWLYFSTKQNKPKKFSLNYASGTSIFLVCLLLYIESGADSLLQTYSMQLCNDGLLSKLSHMCGYSKWFLADYPIAIAFALISAAVISPTKEANAWITKFAPHTFGIYLMHYPILLAASTVFPKPQGVWFGSLIVAATFSCTIFMSTVFDKSRPWLQRVFESFFSKVKLPSFRA